MEIVFILVQPAVPENIGAAARAIKTMGFGKLRLVDPPGYPNEKVFHVAHGSKEVIEKALLFPTLQEALHDVDFAVASSAKKRAVRYDYHHASSLAEILEKKTASVKRAAIVFGREESGLSNEEISLCDIISFIPMKAKYPSLNLSHAVMLYAYLLSPYSNSRTREMKTPGKGKAKQMKSLAVEALEGIRFRKNSNIYSRIFERLSLLGDDDVNLVLSFLDKLNKRLK